jgi:hypothetical protein
MSRLCGRRNSYDGAKEEKHGQQVALVGDTVVDDCFGEGIAVRIDGGNIVIDFDEDDERVEKSRTKGHVFVYALEQRERVQQPRTGHGRRRTRPQGPPPAGGAQVRVREAPRPDQGGPGVR